MTDADSAGAGQAVVHIVDDDAAVRDSLRALLESFGYDVCTYALARDFLAEHQRIYDGCLLTDLHMPEMNGIELIEALRARGSMGAAVIMTGRGDSRLREQAVKAGAYALLDKPVDETRLHKAIENAISQAA